MTEDIKKKIILRLIHNPQLTFNELWGKEGESNLFAYHLGKLQEEGLVQKDNEGYKLTAEGLKLSAFIEGDTGGKAELPTPVVIVLVRDGKKLLCQKRLKHPFYGYWGFVSGKQNFGFNILDCAKRDLYEEAGLMAEELEYRGLEQLKTYQGEKLLYHHMLHIVEVTKFSGTLKEKTHKAENAFLLEEEYKSREHFPGEQIFETVLSSTGFFIIEGDRFMDG